MGLLSGILALGACWMFCGCWPSQWPDVTVGFHLGRAAKSREAWEYTNRLCGRLAGIGAGLLILAALGMALGFASPAWPWWLLAPVGVITVMAVTCCKVWRRFDEKGRER